MLQFLKEKLIDQTFKLYIMDNYVGEYKMIWFAIFSLILIALLIWLDVILIKWLIKNPPIL